jgi:ABC-type phosphate transport system substrate-binding protein
LAAAAAVSVSLAGTAQAQTTGAHAGAKVPLTATPATVAAGLNTGVSLTNPCTTGVTPSSVTGFPAPDGTTTNLRAVLAKAPTKVRLAGVWPAPGPTTYSVTVTCPDGTTGTSTVTVESAPAPGDVTGVGSDTIQNVMDAFSADYNASHTTGNLYSWDATNPVTAATGDNITTKQGCTAIPRPNGSSAGITALTTENGTTGGHPCIDFARSSRARGTDPTSVTFATLAGDAVTYATQPSSNAPANLTTAQLNQIYSCAVTNWSQVGGKSAPIHAFIPQTGSGTRSFFLSAIGLTNPGSCVSDASGTLEENEGVNPVLNTSKADVIFPFSVGKYLAERYHSATCFNTTCTANSNGIKCTPKGAQNLFGCNTHGTMVLNEVNGTAPTTPFPLTPTTTKAVINAGFTSAFQRFLFEVLNSPEFSIPAYLQKYFSPTGYVCTNATAKKDLQNYGFLVLPAGTAAGDCGSLS